MNEGGPMKNLFVLIVLLFCSTVVFTSGGKESPRNLCLMFAGAESAEQRDVLENLCLVNGITEFSWPNALRGFERLQSKIKAQKLAIKELRGEGPNKAWNNALKLVRKTAKDGVRQIDKKHRRHHRQFRHQVYDQNIRTAMKVAVLGAQHDEEAAQRILNLKASCAQKVLDLQEAVQAQQAKIESQEVRFEMQKARLIETRDSLSMARQLARVKDTRLAGLQLQLDEARATIRESKEQQEDARQGATAGESRLSVSSALSAVSNFFSS
jgi:hypothetical protein